MKQYYVQFINDEGNKETSSFKRLPEARQFGKECFRSNTFIRLENQNGTKLPL